MPGINHTPKPFFLCGMDGAGNASTHAVRGSLSSEPWNKCIRLLLNNFFKNNTTTILTNSDMFQIGTQKLIDANEIFS